MANFWDDLSGDDEHAAEYMLTYGEGPGCLTRHTLGSFINNGESVLDVGCGPGWNYDHFMEYGPQIKSYLGLDYSERFVRVANQRVPESAFAAGVKTFEVGDVRNISKPDNSWDVVVMQDVLEHTNGYEQPVHEALRVAKKRAIFTFWHMTENDDHVNDDGNDGWGAWYSRPKWEAFLDTLGYMWLHHQIDDGKKPRDFYVVDKEQSK